MAPHANDLENLADSDRVFIPSALTIRVAVAVADAVCGSCHRSAVHTYRYPEPPWRLNRCEQHTKSHRTGLLRQGHTIIDQTDGRSARP